MTIQQNLFSIDRDQHGRIRGFPSMARNTDPETSHAAAVKIEGKLTYLQAEVLHEFQSKNMTAKECEALERFAKWGPSTVRKRISELKTLTKLVETGVRRDGCAEYKRA